MADTYRIRDIEPNPFRHMDRYPIRRNKVEALRESLRTTGFWDNVVARVGDNGKPQIAYGHHRLHALREEYKPTHEVNLIIRDLDDDQMLKIMARENMEEWGTSAAVEQETVRAVVQAYADGLIELGTINVQQRKDQVRYAPGFVQGDDQGLGSDHPYTAQMVADYLGWGSDKVKYTLGALELIDQGALTESDFDGLGTRAAQRVVEEARKAQREREIRERQLQREAEAARQKAEKAKADRAKAQAEAQRRKEQAAAARKEEQRRQREREAREAEARARKAEQEQARQEKAQQAAKERAAKAREQARQEAERAGKQASEALKGGKKGYRSPDLVDPPKRDRRKPPPNIDAFAVRVAGQLNKILDPKFDTRAKDLDQILAYVKYLGPSSARELDLVLGHIIDRAADRRQRLAVDPRDDAIEAEVISDQEMLK